MKKKKISFRILSTKIVNAAVRKPDSIIRNIYVRNIIHSKSRLQFNSYGKCLLKTIFDISHT